MRNVFFAKATGEVANLNVNMSTLQRDGTANCNTSLTRERSRQQYNGKLHLKKVPTNPNFITLAFHSYLLLNEF